MLTIALTSGKGGVGKTSTAANLALALQKNGWRTSIFDADLQLANLDILMGLDPEFNLQHVVAGEKSLREIRVQGPGGVTAFTGASAIPSLMSAGPKRMGTFLGQLADLEHDTDVLLFDTSAGLDNRVMTFLKLSDHTIIVVTPDPTSMTDAYATIKTLNRRHKGARVKILFNMCSEDQARSLFSTLEQVAWNYLKMQVEYLGHIRQDNAVIRATRKRKLYSLESPDSAAAQDIAKVAKALNPLIEQGFTRVA